MPDFVNRRDALEVIRRNAMLRVQDIYDAVASLPVTEREELPPWAHEVGRWLFEAHQMPHIKKPLAWALYQAWKRYDEEGR